MSENQTSGGGRVVAEKVDPSWLKWRNNVAYGLIEARDEAEARYLREHRRAVFMAATLQKVWDAMPDIVGRTPSPERALKALEDVADAMGRWVNAMGGDDAWYEVKFDFDEWERDYFGPKPDEALPNEHPREELKWVSRSTRSDSPRPSSRASSASSPSRTASSWTFRRTTAS